MDDEQEFLLDDFMEYSDEDLVAEDEIMPPGSLVKVGQSLNNVFLLEYM